MDVTDISERELRMFMEDMMQLSQCVECRATLTPPVVTCQQGHFSCHECRKPKCSVCGSNIVNVQLSTVTKWLQHTPRECEFSNRGCKAIILFSTPHESYCPYSYVCELCGAICHLVNHFEAKHKESLMTRNIVNGYWHVNEKNQLKYFLINGSLFRVSISLASGYLTTEVYCMRSKRSDVDFIYTMEYRNEEVQFTYTGFVLDYKSKDKYADNDENFMNVPASKLPFLYVDGRLNYTFRISRLKQEAAAEAS